MCKGIFTRGTLAAKSLVRVELDFARIDLVGLHQCPRLLINGDVNVWRLRTVIF